jgi:hypothetical protein
MRSMQTTKFKSGAVPESKSVTAISVVSPTPPWGSGVVRDCTEGKDVGGAPVFF